MGYIKLTKGAAAATAGKILVPADNVASIKDDGGEAIIKYFGGYELVLDFDGASDQKDIVAILEAINEANGASGPAISCTTPEDENLVGATVRVWDV
tara:strand:- start:1323 stop:1613 length:291 start_codon:yes stop_codon:yes gene_type:complete